jgi:hypothetical protein
MNDHGGKRDGAGRKPIPETQRLVTISASVPKWVVELLPLKNKSAFIRDALIEKLAPTK